MVKVVAMWPNFDCGTAKKTCYVQVK